MSFLDWVEMIAAAFVIGYVIGYTIYEIRRNL